MIKYNKLFALLAYRGMRKTDLLEAISSPTILSRLSKNEPVNITTIDKICDFLDVQPSDIMEHVKE